MKNVLIVSANEYIRNTLSQIVSKQENKLRIFQTNNITKACEIILVNNIELMLVEDSLNKNHPNNMEGLMFIEKVREIEHYAFVPIIVISSASNMELYIYKKLHCYGFLDKSFSNESAAELIKDALRYQKRKKYKEYICLKDGGVVYPVSIREILYIEHRNRNMYIHTLSKELKIPYYTCKEIMNELYDCKFELCARGVLVNLNYIDALDVGNRSVILKDSYGTLVWGRTYIKSLKAAFKNKSDKT